MKSALKKAVIGLAVAIAVFAALFVPGLMSTSTTTDVATQNLSEAVPADAPAAAPTAAPTEIVLPTATAVPATATTIPATPTPMPAAVVVVAPTEIPTEVPTPAPTEAPTVEPTAEPVEIASAEAAPAPTAPPTPEPTATDVPTVAPTVEPTAVPTEVPTLEPTAVPTEAPTAEPTVEPTPEPTATPTVAPTVEPTAEPTEVAEAAAPTIDVPAIWMYVTATDGLFLRDAPGGQITTVLTYRAEVHVTGTVESNGQRLWVEVDVPQPGWVALEFLSAEQPAPPAVPPTVGDGRPSEPPTEADWIAFRNCESGGRYDVVDPSGLYHGAYQFLPSTWDGLARRFWPELVGVLPSQASPADQDKMALKLFELEGTRPWPTCGRHLL